METHRAAGVDRKPERSAVTGGKALEASKDVLKRKKRL